MKAVLELSGITLAYGGVVVLDAVDLTVAPGEVVALIGPNGAGKSSLLDVAAGVVAPRGGSVRVAGVDVTRHAPRRRHALGLARTHQTPSLLGPDPCAEVALAAGRGRSVLAGAIRAPSRADRARALRALERVGLPAEVAHADASVLGLPDQRRVELARALVCDPVVLMLDEPASGLTPSDRVAFVELVAGLASPACGVLLVEHDMDLVREVADRVVALDQGSVVATGSFDAVTTNARVREAYLGVAS